MATEPVSEGDQLVSELKSILEELAAVRVRFVGPSPGPESSADAWNEATTLNRLIRRDESDPTPNELDFATSWHEAVLRVRSTVYDRLIPWADRFVTSVGKEQFTTEVPDPPQEVMSPAMGLEGGVLDAITGTGDTVEAGRRIICWAAADLNPATLNRSGEHRYLFWRWTGQLLEWRENEIGTIRLVLEALQSTFDAMRCDDFENLDADEQDAECALEQYKIRQQSPEAFLVEFGREIGEISGVAAKRFVRLCREKIVDVEVLADELPPGTTSKSVVIPDELPDAQRAALVSEAKRLGIREARDLERQFHEALEEIDLQLEACTSEERREELESQRVRVVREINALRRVPESDLRRWRNRIEKSLDRLAQDLREKNMPCFSNHLIACWEFDDIQERYRYLDSTGIGWEFVDF